MAERRDLVAQEPRTDVPGPQSTSSGCRSSLKLAGNSSEYSSQDLEAVDSRHPVAVLPTRASPEAGVFEGRLEARPSTANARRWYGIS